jgi:PAS domain S-box-containing protein
VRHAWWRGYLLVLLVVAAGYAVLPVGTGREWLAMIVGASAPIAIVVGLTVHRPPKWAAWSVLCTAEVALLASKIAVRVEPPADVSGGPPVHGQLFVLSYLLMTVGLTVMARPVVRRDPAMLIDALIVAVGAGVTSWVFLMAPTTADESLPTVTKITLIACPMLDIALLTVAVPAVLSGRTRPLALRLLLVWLSIQLVVDAVTTTLVLNGSDPLDTPVTGGWLVAVAFLGAAALHPSTATPVDRQAGTDQYRLNHRLPVLVTAGLLAPIVQAVNAIHAGHGETAVIATATTATVVLVLTRIGWLVRMFAMAQSRLSANEAMLTESQRLAQVGSWSWDIPTGLMTWSPQFYDLLDVDPRTTPSFERFIEAVHPEDRMDRVDRVQQALDGWRPTRERFRVVRSDGETRVLHAEVAQITDDIGRPTRIVGTAQDVTESDVAQRQVQELAAIVEFSHDAVLRVTPAGVVTRWNAGAERLFGYGSDEVTGNSADMLLPPSVLDDPSSWHRTIGDDLPNGGRPIEGFETTIRCKDGRSVPVAMTVSPIWDGEHGNRYTGAAVIVRDITQRKQLEDQLTRQALHDPLTGLANRELLLRQLERAIGRIRRPTESIALFFIDLDD